MVSTVEGVDPPKESSQSSRRRKPVQDGTAQSTASDFSFHLWPTPQSNLFVMRRSNDFCLTTLCHGCHSHTANDPIEGNSLKDYMNWYIPTDLNQRG